MSLTVGQASGVIAFGVVIGKNSIPPDRDKLTVRIVQILLPLAIIIVLVSLVQDNHNAATW